MFLETITVLDYDALVPINRIKFIHITYKQSWEIHIHSDDGDWIERFKNDDELNKRYEEIKKLLNIAKYENQK